MTVGTDADAIDGVVPASVAAPATAEEMTRVLAEASRTLQPTVIRGGRTKLGWGRKAARVGLAVDTRGLNRVTAHRHGDLIAIVEGGARVADVNRELAQHRQWLPIDAPEGATIGGVLSTNDSGPLRHRYGTPRDLLIGIALATTDGRLIKAGGPVVKNVAGYDLGKLVCGAHGSFAAIVSATFKLVPWPIASQTLVARFADAASAAAAIAVINASQIEPLAFDLHRDADAAGGVALLIRVASTAGAVEAQMRRLALICERADRDPVEKEAEETLWRQQRGMVWDGAGTVARLSWMITNSGPLLALVDEIEEAEAVRITLVGRAGLGAGLVRIDGKSDAQRRVIERLRAAAPLVRHVAVLRATPEIKAAVDVWGDLGTAAPALRALKQAFDPTGILNAGRGPI